ncbi:MAG: ABC transporter substrate-binding protein, partial [Candidatus Kariarchaeaceae archaeon]
KQAVAPLGIKIKVVAKPFGQFVGDLMHTSSAIPFDLGFVSFTSIGPIPEFGETYSSKDPVGFGCLSYQLCKSDVLGSDKDFQNWQFQDVGFNNTHGGTVLAPWLGDKDGDGEVDGVDALIDEIDFTLNVTRKQELLDVFSRLFMDSMLYDIPTVLLDDKQSVWKGWGGAENLYYRPDQGRITSQLYGAKWDPNPPERIAAGFGTNQLRFASSTPAAVIFDWMTVRDTATGLFTDFTFDGLFRTEEGTFIRYPNLGYNVIQEDWNVTETVITNTTNSRWYGNSSLWTDPVTKDVAPLGNITVWIHEGDQPGTADDITWAESADGVSTLDDEFFTVRDIAFTYDIYKMENSAVNGKANREHIVGYEIHPDADGINDAISFYIEPGFTTLDDLGRVNGIFPMPAHRLNATQLTPTDGSPKGFAYELDARGYNPQQTVEWINFNTKPAMTTSLGMYQIRAAGFKEAETWGIDKRTDYWYKNMWDTKERTNVFGGVYAPHLGAAQPQVPYAWVRKDVTAAQKAVDDFTSGAILENVTLSIDTIDWVIIDDPTTVKIKFEAGELDGFSPLAFGAQQVKDHEDDPRFNVFSVLDDDTPQFFMMNLVNPHLRQYKVRRAIAHVIDLDVLVKIRDGFAIPNSNPVTRYYKNYFKDEFGIPYNYTAAREIMRDLGYDAADDNNPDKQAGEVPVETVASQIEEEVDAVINEVTESLGSEYLFVFVAFTVTTFSIIRRRKK